MFYSLLIVELNFSIEPSVMLLTTISTLIHSRGLVIPRKRVLLNYWIAIATILGISGISLYFFVIKSLNQQLNQDLLTLAEAASPSLSMVKDRGKQDLQHELSWRNLFSEQEYSLEWYDPSGKLIAREGKNLMPSPVLEADLLAKLKAGTPVFHRHGQMQTVTISVYSNNLQEGKLKLEGYIRTSQSTQTIEDILKPLRLGLELGGATTIVLVSISSIYLTTETLKPMKQSMKSLRRITASVSHQVRTPLTRISIATEILLGQTSEIQQDRVRKLNIINAATEQIRRLLEELLLLIRIDTAPYIEESRFSSIPLFEIAQSIAEQFEPIAEAKNIDLQTQLSNNTFVKGDREKLNRLLTILLENAIEYTDPGGNVFFSLEQSRNTITITVKDTGIGISQEHLPSIFQYFWRSEIAKNKDPDSFGLGLTIAKAIVQQHRGKITVNSEIGRGSCFQIHLHTA